MSFNLSYIKRNAKNNPKYKAFLESLDKQKDKIKVTKKIIKKFSDFEKEKQEMLLEMNQLFNDVVPELEISVRGSRIHGYWHENSEAHGTSDWDLTIKRSGKKKLTDAMKNKLIDALPEIAKKLGIKIDPNLFQTDEKSVLIKK